MQVFEFYRDQMIAGWERVRFSVRAENRDKAIERLRIIQAEGLPDDDQDVNVRGSEMLIGSESLVPSECNEDDATEEFYDQETEEMIFDNVGNEGPKEEYIIPVP